jgi:hypothetical protein
MLMDVISVDVCAKWVGVRAVDSILLVSTGEWRNGLVGLVYIFSLLCFCGGGRWIPATSYGRCSKRRTFKILTFLAFVKQHVADCLFVLEMF